MLGFFSLSITQQDVLNQVPQGGAALLIFLNKKWMLSCAAWGKTSIIWTDLAKKKYLGSGFRVNVSSEGSCYLIKDVAQGLSDHIPERLDLVRKILYWK